jgi:MarR family transcriptional regulator, transcriptional regulator for hemolysin
MRPRNPRREFAFLISDVARLMRTYADQRVRSLGMTRAQWAVLARLEHHEGLKQSELAEMLDLQPITLTRLVDRLAANGLIERRPDPNDRRAKRLYLTPLARPLMDRLADLGQDVMGTVLEGFNLATVERMILELSLTKENLKNAIARKSAEKAGEKTAAAA